MNSMNCEVMAMALSCSLPRCRLHHDVHRCNRSLSNTAMCSRAGSEDVVSGVPFLRSGKISASANSVLTRPRNPCGGGGDMKARVASRGNRSGWLASILVGSEISTRQAGGAVARNAEGGKEPKAAVVMVDPVEAKRLAALEMSRLQSQILFQRNQRIEATNGGWAVLGLTAGIVVEGSTGKGILIQLADYLVVVSEFVNRFASSS